MRRASPCSRCPPAKRPRRARRGRAHRRAARRGFGRDTTIIALGGGVVGDLAGFVAATFMRGVPYIQVPTSLLAMIDASVGGKTGVDTRGGKESRRRVSSAGRGDRRHRGVWQRCRSSILRAGLAEAIKHGVIADAAYFDAVARSRAAARDARRWRRRDVRRSSRAASRSRPTSCAATSAKSGVRKMLNFGHTIGHAIELCSGFSLLHGEAIAIGMVYESALAERLGIAQAGTAARIRDAVDRRRTARRRARRRSASTRFSTRRAATRRHAPGRSSTRCRSRSARWPAQTVDGRCR